MKFTPLLYKLHTYIKQHTDKYLDNPKNSEMSKDYLPMKGGG